ncbi:unnamed protein product [Effrenium voratum]|nr:unnamed protein product [Effrenium voratum]CAJ1434248.1 unnamed protein product [Effrenium voratum]
MWSNFAEGLGCRNPKVNANDEVSFASSPALDELDPEEDKWSDEELLKCFEQEAVRIKASLTDIHFEDLATSLSTRWLKRIVKDDGDEKRRGRHLRALLRSRALDILLSTLTRSEVGRQAIYVASSIDPERESIECAHISPAVPLRLLLSRASDVPGALMGSMLVLLSVVGRQDAKAAALSQSQDLHWVLLLLSAAMVDSSEVPVRMSQRNVQVVEESMAKVVEWWMKATVQPLGDASTRFTPGDAVWAEWPRNGRWFRGEVQQMTDEDHIFIKWLERPSNVKGGHEDDYIVSVVGEAFNFNESTAVLRIAVLPANVARPQPIPDLEEEGWSQLMDAAENLTAKFHELRTLFEDLGKDNPAELQKCPSSRRRSLRRRSRRSPPPPIPLRA